MFDHQEVFDKVCEHLVKQGVKSRRFINEDSVCAYRGENGLMCAVGCLIPDELYNVNFEGFTPFHINRNHCGVFNTIFGETLTKEDFDFLRELQHVHDEYAVAFWGIKLKEVAERFSLELPGSFDDV